MYMMNLTMHEFIRQMEEKRVNTVLIPIGMLEAHGEHCALGTDMLIPREFVRRLESRVGDKVMVAPEIPYGHSFALAPFRGTIDVPARVFEDYVAAIGGEFIKQGFRHIVLFNGHGGNMPSLSNVSERLADLGAYMLTINWWLDYRDHIVPIAPAVGHAGEDETSCVLAIDPSLVEMEYAHDHEDTVSRKIKAKDLGRRIYPHANSGNATQATAEKGESIYNALVEDILADLASFWAFANES